MLRMSDTQQIDGPGQTLNAMTTDQKFADELRSYLNQGSAAARYGNLLTLPMGSGLLYVMPIYTTREASTGTGTYPALRFVVVRFGEHVGIGNTLQEALDQVFVGDAGAETGEDPDQTPTEPTEPTDPTEPTEPTAADRQAAVALDEEGGGRLRCRRRGAPQGRPGRLPDADRCSEGCGGRGAARSWAPG